MSNKALIGLITLIPGSSERARALNWVQTDGLWQASQGREQLLKLVKEQADKLAGTTIPLNTARNVKNVEPSRNVAEMARSVYGVKGPDPFDQNDFEITSHDLFSREAHQNLPILDQIRLDGLTIDEYYEKHFEPQDMPLSITYDLNQLREAATKYGFPPFRFGGMNGYIQWIEKGDWQKDIRKRSVVSPNDQVGINVAPLMEKNPETGEMDTVEKFNKNGKPVYHFAGGSVSSDIDRAGSVIHKMTVKFNQVAHAVETGQPTQGISPEDFEFWKNMFHVNKSIESKTSDPNSVGQGRQSYARQAGMPNTNNDAFTVLPPHINAENYQKAVWIGLQYPFTMSAKSFANPAGFGPWVDDPKEAMKGPNGWYNIDEKKNLHFSLNDNQQEEILHYIFLDFDHERKRFIVKNYFNPAYKNAAMEMPSLALCKPATNTRFLTEQILNNGFKNDEEAKKLFKTTIHQLKGHDPSAYSYEPATSKKELYKNGANDPDIEKLMDNGFEWKGGKNPLEPFFLYAYKKAYELSGGQTPTPEQWNAAYQAVDQDKTLKGLRKIGYLTNGSKSLEVSFSKDEKGIKRWHIFVPNEHGKGKPIKPPKFGDLGASVLAGGEDIDFSGGASDHIQMNKVGPKTWSKLLNRLLMGEKGGLGEVDGSKRGPFNNEMELPCVRYGITTAKKYFNSQHKNDSDLRDLKEPSHYFSDQQLASWAVEALSMHSNDQAFQIGWLDQDEFDEFTGRDSSNKGGANIDLDAEAEAQKQGERNGKGIKAMMLRNGLLDGNETDEETKHIIYQWIQKHIKETKKDGILIDGIWKVDPDLARSLAENGYEFRARNIGKYVLNQMNNTFDADKASGGKNLSSMGGRDDNGDERSLDMADDGFDGQGEYKAQKKDLSNKDIGGILGIKSEPPAPAPVSGPVPTPNPVIKAKPTPTPTPTAPAAAKAPEQSRPISSFDSMMPPAPAVAAKAAPVQQPKIIRSFDSMLPPSLKKESDGLLSYEQWRSIREMVGTGVVSTNKKPHDGDGWNWWGAPGKTGGTSITGDADTASSDPVGKKGMKRGSKRK